MQLETKNWLQIAFHWFIRILFLLKWSLPLFLLLLLCENKNSAQGLLVKCIFISGTVDLQGCGHEIHAWGMRMPEPCSEGLVQGCDDRNPQVLCSLWVRITCLWSLGSALGMCLCIYSLCLLVAHFSWLRSKPCWLRHEKLHDWH